MSTTLTARGPADLLAAVPLVLGFRPEESLVMLTFGPEHTFHARLDLPPPSWAGGFDDAADAMLGPCLTHGVERVVFIVYSDDATSAAGLAAVLVPAFVADGIDVIDVLRAHAGRWCHVPIRAGGHESDPVAYDERGHPFAARAVLDGRVTHETREELRELVAPRPDVRERWAGLLAGRPEPGVAEVALVPALLADRVGSGVVLDDADAVRVLRATTRPEVRDAVIETVFAAATGEGARDHLALWAALLRGAPDPQVPDTAAVAAFCAWQSGDGALAWCALDRCFELDPDHGLATCLAGCLARAVPPTGWQEVSADEAAERRSA